MKLHVLSLVLGLTATPCLLWAQEGAFSNSNRDVFVLPGNAAMGKADVAFCRDATLQSNPANLALDSASEVDFSYSGYYGNIFSTSCLSYVAPVEKTGGMGISVSYLNVPNIELTDKLDVTATGDPVWDPSKLEYASFSDLFVNLSYGRKWAIRRDLCLSAGGRLHGERRRMPDETGYGIGLDAGVTAELPEQGLRFSLQGDDVTTNYIYWNAGYKDYGSPSARLGIGWRVDVPYFYGKFTFAYKTPDVVSLDRTWMRAADDGQRLVVQDSLGDAAASFLYMGHYGAEYLIRDIVALRVGFSEGSFCFGGGVSAIGRCVPVDFSYVASDLGGTYNLSVGFRF